MTITKFSTQGGFVAFSERRRLGRSVARERSMEFDPRLLEVSPLLERDITRARRTATVEIAYASFLQVFGLLLLGMSYGS